VAYRQRSRDAGFELSSVDDELDDLATSLIDAIVAEGADPQVAADLALVARFYERIGDHAVNLARRIDMLAAPRRLESRKAVRSKRVIVASQPKRKRGYVSRLMRKVGKLRLAPTDEGFFVLFENSAENARECAENFRKLLESSTDLEECFEAIKGCERRGDELTREILGRLDASFVTPYDREDIHALAEEVDDVVDDIFAAASLIELVGIEDQPEELPELTDVLVTMTGEMAALIGSMRRGDGARHRLERIEYLERQGDLIFRRGMGGLFNGGFDALHVIKWKDIVEATENAINSIENVSDVVESILVKSG
jgi:predicted phosphate transport protein (TIGR00153 family)